MAVPVVWLVGATLLPWVLGCVLSHWSGSGASDGGRVGVGGCWVAGEGLRALVACSSLVRFVVGLAGLRFSWSGMLDTSLDIHDVACRCLRRRGHQQKLRKALDTAENDDDVVLLLQGVASVHFLSRSSYNLAFVGVALPWCPLCGALVCAAMPRFALGPS